MGSSSSCMVPRGALYWDAPQSFRHLVGGLFARNLDSSGVTSELGARFAEIFGVDRVILTGRARVALELLLESFDLPRNTRVLLPPITIRGMLDVVVGLGLSPLIYDYEPNSMVPKVEEIISEESGEPGVLLITPLWGMSDDFRPLITKARTAGWLTLMDISQAVLTRFDREPLWVGSDYVFASLSALKPIDTLGGGLLFSPVGHSLQKIFTAERALDSQRRSNLLKFAVRNLAYAIYAKPLALKTALLIFRGLDRVAPGLVFRQVGKRSTVVREGLPRKIRTRYSDFQAQLGLEAISRIVRNTEARVANSAYLRDFLSRSPKGVDVLEGTSPGESDYWQFVISVQNPHAWQRELWTWGVDSGATSLSFLPNCEHKAELVGGGKNFSRARHFYFNTLFLCNHPSLSKCQLDLLKRASENILGRG